MQQARPEIGRGQRRVDRRAEPRGELGRLDSREGVVEQDLEFALGLVDEFAHGRALLLGHRAHLFHEGGEHAVGPDVAGIGRLEIGAGGDEREFGGGLGHQDGELVLHRRGWERKEDGIPFAGPVLR